MNKNELLESFSINELEERTEFSILGCNGDEEPDCGDDGANLEICEE